MLLRWQPGASQDELSNVPFAYQMVHGWSPDEQEVVDRLVDGLIIAALPPDVTVATLADGLKEGGPFARGHAARTLGRFGPLAAEAVPALVAALEDESPVVRGAAIIALGKIGPKAKAAIPALTAIQDDRLQPLAANAVKAISGI